MPRPPPKRVDARRRGQDAGPDRALAEALADGVDRLRRLLPARPVAARRAGGPARRAASSVEAELATSRRAEAADAHAQQAHARRRRRARSKRARATRAISGPPSSASGLVRERVIVRKSP